MMPQQRRSRNAAHSYSTNRKRASRQHRRGHALVTGAAAVTGRCGSASFVHDCAQLWKPRKSEQGWRGCSGLGRHSHADQDMHNYESLERYINGLLQMLGVFSFAGRAV